MLEARTNEYGDLVCPECGVNIITPQGMFVRPGIGTCPICRKEFGVTSTVAHVAHFRGDVLPQLFPGGGLN